MVNKSKKYFLSTLEKGLKVLNLFDQERTMISQSEIASIIGENKTSTYRLVNTLIALGYLKKDAKTKRLKLGTQSFLLAQSFLRGFDLLQVMRPVIDDFFDEHNLTIDSALIDGESLISVYRRISRDTVTLRIPSSEREFSCTALGRAALAFLPNDKMLHIISKKPLKRWTEYSITEKDELLKELRKTKERGYAIAKEEMALGIIAIGAPIFNMESMKVIGSVCFDLVTSGHSLRSVEENYADLIMSLSRSISNMISVS